MNFNLNKHVTVRTVDTGNANAMLFLTITLNVKTKLDCLRSATDQCTIEK